MSTAPQLTPQPPPLLAPHERRLLLVRREAILLELRALEECLGLPQSQPTRDERQRQRKEHKQTV